MTTKEIQKLVGRMQVLKFHSPVIENYTRLGNEMDVMSMNKSGPSVFADGTECAFIDCDTQN